MKKEVYYENYPASLVIISALFTLAVYVIGAIIIYQLGLIWMVLYLAFIIIQEARLIGGHCRDCYYYGKYCSFGRGKLCSFFFKRGNNKKFCKMKLTWKSIIPDFLISLVPIIIGIVLLIIKFKIWMLLLVVLLFLLMFAGNALVRRNIACKYCKQRKLGCPAEKLFDGKKGLNN
jgi:hypothetical protein